MQVKNGIVEGTLRVLGKLKAEDIIGDLTGNATTATTATNLANNPVVKWTAGTTAGPTLAVTAGNKTSAAVAIPIASASASGVVTNTTQTFGGNKYISGSHIGFVSSSETDKFFDFAYSADPTASTAPGASWRIGALNSGSSDTNYFVIQTGGSDTSATSWINALRIGMNTRDIAIGGNLYPLTNNAKTLGTSSYKWSNVYATTFTGALSGNASTATKLQTARTLTIGNSGKSFDGSANVSWSLNEIGALPGKTTSATTAATAGWYRIAQSDSGIGNCVGVFTLKISGSGYHSDIILNAGISYGKNPTLIQTLYTMYSNAGFTKARIVYHTTYSGNYAYLEVYNPKATALSTYVSYAGYGWTLIAPSTTGSIPSGYTSKELIFSTDKIVGNLAGNADSATISSVASALTTNAGSSGRPVYFKDGIPVECGSDLNVNITGIAQKASQDENGNKIISTYVKKSGDTMTGALNIGTNSFGAMLIERTGSTNGASIQFKNPNGMLGHIGMNAVNGGLLRWSADTTSSYTVLDTGNYTSTLDGRYVNVSGDTMTGTLVLSKTTDASGTANNSPALIVGGTATTEHLEFDANEIVAKSNGTTTARLNLNNDGGNVAVGGFASDSYALSTPSFICNSWVRTNGNTGWYNQTHGGGWYMTDSTWVRSYNGKKIFVDNSSSFDAIYTSGGMRAIKGFSGDLTMSVVPQNNNEINFGGTNATSTIYLGYRATDSRPIPTKFVFGSSTGTANITAGSATILGNATINSNTKTPFNFTADSTYMRKTLGWNQNSYYWHVILLFPVLTTTNYFGHNYIDGKFLMRKTGGNMYDVVEVNANCVYNTLYYFLQNYGQHSGWKLCRCTYNGVQYYALKCPYHANPYTHVEFIGNIKSELTGGTDTVALPLDIPYYNENTSTILNAEVNDSISDTLTTSIMTSVQRYGLQNSSFIGSLSGNASTATKLATARALKVGNKSQNFDGSAGLTWGLSDIGAVTYGTCSTAAGTAAKVVTITNTAWTLQTGAIIVVKFTNTNSANSCTLNVNGTGAKSIWYDTGVYTGNDSRVCGRASRYITYMYDGTNWVWISSGADKDTTYYINSVHVSTASSTAEKVGNTSFYTLGSNRFFMVMLQNDNLAASALTLNINNTGAKPIYLNGVPTSAENYVDLKKGLYLVHYDGTNYYFRTDNKIQGNLAGTADSASKLTTASAGSATRPIYFANGVPVQGNYIWNWSGNQTMPSWVWGGSDGTNMYLYNPAKFDVQSAEKVRVRDIRSETSSPDNLGEKKMSAFFSNVDMPSSAWYSGINIKGWSSGYQTWQLVSGASTSANNNLYYRTGISSWDSWHLLIDNNSTQTISGAKTFSGNNTFSGTNSFTGTNTFSKASGFNYSGIENGTSAGARVVWYAHGSNKGTPVYDNDFTYDPSTNALTVGASGSFTGGVGNFATAVGKPKGYLAYAKEQYITTTNTHTGYIKITLPAVNSNTMLQFTVNVYNYVDHTSTKYIVSGYKYSSGPNWAHTSAICLGKAEGAKSNLTVRFGASSATNHFITIGEVDTAWSYPQITISDITVGYSDSGSVIGNWDDGWKIEFATTAFANIHKTHSNTHVGYGSVAAKTRTTTTDPTSATTYNVPFSSGSETTLRINDGFRYNTLQGTTSALGVSGLYLGNSTASGTAGNKYGRILIYGTGSNYWYINGNKALTTNRTLKLPNSDGCITVVPTDGTAVGSSTKGTYVNANGVVTAMTYSLSATVNAGAANKLAYYSGANAIDDYTSTTGSSTTPIYLNAGVPTACGYSFTNYLPLAGGTMTGRITAYHTGGSWYQGRNNRGIIFDRQGTNTDGWWPWLGGKTPNGDWTIGTLSDTFYIKYVTNTDYTAGNNTAVGISISGSTITGNLSGNASSSSKVNVTATTSNTNYYIVGATGTGNQSLYRAYNASGTANTAGVYFNGASGVLYGAAWNDYAEFRSQKEEIQPGYCVVSSDNGEVSMTTELYQACDGIVSDTFGFAIGESEQSKTPLAVAGRVLAYCAGDREDYHAGDTVCAGPGGLAYKMTREEIREWPDRIVGLVSEIPQYETWGINDVKVNGRIWIKVK